MATIRQARVGERIKRDLSEIIQREMRDPRLNMVTITAVEVTRDFSQAQVYYCVLAGDKEAQDAALAGLIHAGGFLRGKLGKLLEIRTIPELFFKYDEAMDRGVRMFDIIKEEQQYFTQNPVIPEEVIVKEAKATKERVLTPEQEVIGDEDEEELDNLEEEMTEEESEVA
jgi:ribosome-binding factor A